ncbi:MAG TPA: uracil-DNA glycosylase [Thermoanaerobaculia bacterium]|nr:uracil-DNA glycosylase [Thermoanaerobaculia bacterium]
MTPLLLDTFRGPVGNSSGIVNPYRDEDGDLDRSGAARLRRKNLRIYVERVGEPRLVLLGEAIGYRGGRFSGIPFTSERQIAGEGQERLAWTEGAGFRATSRHPALWLEPSGTIVWSALAALPSAPHGVLLWNAFPWHPQGAGGALSNRTPERAMLLANLHILETLLSLLPARTRIAAVGRTAEAALARLGAAAVPLRHPAHGGATRFRAQLGELLSEIGISRATINS